MRIANSTEGLRKLLTIVVAVLVGCLGFSFASIAVDQETQTDMHEFNVEAHRLTSKWEFWVYTEGTITLTVDWTGPRNLRLFLYGPRQEDPYLDVRAASPTTQTFVVTSEILARGQGRWKWEFQLGNASNSLAQGSVSVTYPKSLPKINYFKAEALHGDSLPLLSQETGIATYAAFPTQEFTLNWSVELAISGLSLGCGCGAVAPELPHGVATDCPNPTTRLTSTRGSRSETLGELGQVYTLIAKNKHGTTEAQIVVVPKVWVGFSSISRRMAPSRSVCIGCAPCQDCGRTPEAERIGAILREIEEKLNAGCIRDNTNLDRFNDPYLRDGLTVGILNAMYDLIVYPDDDFLPDLGARTKCDIGVYGYTPGNKEYVMICLRKGADGLTLLHELEHLVDPNTTECRAPWVAQWCYGCPSTIPCPTCSE